MWKDKLRSLFNYIIRHSKVTFPAIVIIVATATVVLSLNAGNQQDAVNQSDSAILANEVSSGVSTDGTGQTQEVAFTRNAADAVLEINHEGELYTLVATYYNALANGDVDTIKSISNYLKSTEEIRISELSKYIESYPFIEIYSKLGPEENSYIVYVYFKVTFYGYEDQVPGLQSFYVCTDENGDLYMNTGEVTEDVMEYIRTVSLQDDVVELNNRINVEYNDVFMNNSQLFDYVAELEREVSKATGETLAAQITETETAETITDGETGQTEEAASEEPTTASEDPVYATATTTVNVRSSDSEQADKLGQLTGGSNVQVVEQLVNGWSKIVFDGKDGYIKSEFLQVAGTVAADSSASIGTVTAITNINIRASASETADKVGIAAGGDALELLSKDNGWCKIRYGSFVGFVKEEYVQ